jgi:RNA polymerase sigma-70 factor (ECF subfamily)
MPAQLTQAVDERRWPAFEAEALPHVGRLFRLAMWFARNRTEAEEVVQDTLLQALGSFHRFRPGTNCRAWLVQILQHVMSNRRRARRRSPLVDDPDGRIVRTFAAVPPLERHLTDERILDALQGIAEPFQQVIVLRDVEELSYREIATALRIPVGTVMSRLHRGRALLRSQLAPAAAAE